MIIVDVDTFLDTLMGICDQMLEQEALIDRAEEQLRALRVQFSDMNGAVIHGMVMDDRLPIAYNLYWHTKTPAKVIAAFLGGIGENAVARTVGYLPSGVFCAKCGNEYHLTSRTDPNKTEIGRYFREHSGGWTCYDCRWAKRDNERHPSPVNRDIERERLRTMAYSVYLATEHWKITREDALKRAKYHCQVCNSSRRLNVHHRTYKNRGAERPEDLIVLCRECHELFHRQGKLVT